MGQDPRLERYLESLERALKGFPVSDRADVITEIRSHVLSALERDPNANLESVLTALGEPETVANRYLMERGLKTSKPSISPIVRWMVIGFLGTFAMVLIFTGFVIAQFSPLLKVDDDTDSVTLLGGLIQVNGEKNEIKIKGISKGHTIEGELDAEELKKIAIDFNAGRLKLGPSSDARLVWHCHAVGEQDPKIEKQGDGAHLDFTGVDAHRCEIELPANVDISVKSTAGQVEVDSIKSNLDVALTTGKVKIHPDDGVDYHYELDINVGQKPDPSQYKSSDKPSAKRIKVHVNTGKISFDA